MAIPSLESGISNLRFFRFAKNRTDAAKFSRRPGAVPVDPHRAARGQTADVAEHRVRIRHVPPEKVTDVTGWLRREIDFSTIAQWFDLRGDAEGVAVVRIIERFNSERIAREEETLSLLIPYGERI